MDSDLNLDSILSMGWVGFQICEILWIWIWFRIEFCPWVGSDFKSEKSYAFGCGVGFTVGHRLDRIMDLFFAWIWVRVWIHFFSQIQIRIRESESDNLYSTVVELYYRGQDFLNKVA